MPSADSVYFCVPQPVWYIRRPLAPIAVDVPPTLRALLAARLDQLDGAGVLGEADDLGRLEPASRWVACRQVEVRVVAPGSIERSLGKAKRVIDKRPKG